MGGFKPNRQVLPPLTDCLIRQASKADNSRQKESFTGEKGTAASRSSTIRPVSFLKKQSTMISSTQYSLERPMTQPIGYKYPSPENLPEFFFERQGYASNVEYLKNMVKYFNLDNPAPFVSARSWIVTDIETGELWFAKRENEKRQCASLTKVMTFMVVHKMLD